MAGDSHPREMTIWPPRVAKQNSAYGPTTLLPMTGGKPYPEQWERVADLRVFRTSPDAWEKLIAWRTDMGKRGWRLLRVTHEGPELVAVFGRTKADRQDR
jgi:hypothetical protein